MTTGEAIEIAEAISKDFEKDESMQNEFECLTTLIAAAKRWEWMRREMSCDYANPEVTGLLRFDIITPYLHKMSFEQYIDAEIAKELNQPNTRGDDE